MNRIASLSVALLFAIAGTLVATCSHAQDMEGTFDISPKFRARIAKEKAKQATNQSSQNGNVNSGMGGDGSSQCGAQNIGNIDTNGRVGTAPREVFVFAPNAINMVNNGCN